MKKEFSIRLVVSIVAILVVIAVIWVGLIIKRQKETGVSLEATVLREEPVSIAEVNAEDAFRFLEGRVWKFTLALKKEAEVLLEEWDNPCLPSEDCVISKRVLLKTRIMPKSETEQKQELVFYVWDVDEYPEEIGRESLTRLKKLKVGIFQVSDAGDGVFVGAGNKVYLDSVEIGPAMMSWVSFEGPDIRFPSARQQKPLLMIGLFGLPERVSAGDFYEVLKSYRYTLVLMINFTPSPPEEESSN